jgi:hypothetical protein
MEEDGFDYLLTSDKNLQHQQNLNKYSFGFIVLNVVNNNYESILPLLEQIRNFLTAEASIKVKVIK